MLLADMDSGITGLEWKIMLSLMPSTLSDTA